MVLLHFRQLAVPQVARWLFGLCVSATCAANVAHGPIGAQVAAWPAVVLVGTYELLMLSIRSTTRVSESECGVSETGSL